MMQFEITAVSIDDHSRPCCGGTIREAGIGRARGPVTAAQIRDDTNRRQGEYYAMLGGTYRPVIAVDCAECGEPHLTTSGRFSSRLELLGLPTMMMG